MCPPCYSDLVFSVCGSRLLGVLVVDWRKKYE
jgi:hypothetical protein